MLCIVGGAFECLSQSSQLHHQDISDRSARLNPERVFSTRAEHADQFLPSGDQLEPYLFNLLRCFGNLTACLDASSLPRTSVDCLLRSRLTPRIRQPADVRLTHGSCRRRLKTNIPGYRSLLWSDWEQRSFFSPFSPRASIQLTAFRCWLYLRRTSLNFFDRPLHRSLLILLGSE
jgi:hypothetical protein